MNNNYVYDYSLFIKEMNRQIELQRANSNIKVLKVLEDTIKVLDSTRKLNSEESNKFLQIFAAALVASQIIK